MEVNHNFLINFFSYHIDIILVEFTLQYCATVALFILVMQLLVLPLIEEGSGPYPTMSNFEKQEKI